MTNQEEVWRWPWVQRMDGSLAIYLIENIGTDTLRGGGGGGGQLCCFPMLFLTGMCEYESEGNGSFLTLK